MSRTGAAWFVAFFGLLPACSSDTAPEPEAVLETPGAFTAVDEAEGGSLTVYRTLDTLTLPNDTIVFATVYDVEPTSYEEAREMAQDHAIPIRVEVQFLSRAALSGHPYRVVWFRTLTDEEKERIP
jgi:hypothetical protein